MELKEQMPQSQKGLGDFLPEMHSLEPERA